MRFAASEIRRSADRDAGTLHDAQHLFTHEVLFTFRESGTLRSKNKSALSRAFIFTV